MAIEQIKVGFDNFSYIIYDLISKESAVVDPSININKQVDFLKSKQLDLKYIINTHHHRDHTLMNDKLKKMYPEAKITISETYKRILSIKSKLKVSEGSNLK